MILAFSYALFCSQVEVVADSFEADENALLGKLDGNVVVKNGDYDTLYSQHAKIFFNQKKQATKYLAYKNARFQVKFNNKSYKGSADEISYEPLIETYTLNGSAFLHEIESDKKLYGNKIVVDKLKNVYSVYSSKNEPVKFIFELEKTK